MREVYRQMQASVSEHAFSGAPPHQFDTLHRSASASDTHRRQRRAFAAARTRSWSILPAGHCDGVVAPPNARMPATNAQISPDGCAGPRVRARAPVG